MPDILTTERDSLAFDDAVRAAGQACRDALARVRAWHVKMGMKP